MTQRRSRKLAPLTDRERTILEKWGEPLRQLYSGEREPRTPAQAHFVRAAHGEVRPTTPYETAFIKFVLLRAQERGLLEESDGGGRSTWTPPLPPPASGRASAASVRPDGAASDEVPIDVPPPARKRLRKKKNRRFDPEPRVDGIPDHEEGYPSPGWFTDEDWRKLHPGRR